MQATWALAAAAAAGGSGGKAGVRQQQGMWFALYHLLLDHCTARCLLDKPGFVQACGTGALGQQRC